MNPHLPTYAMAVLFGSTLAHSVYSANKLEQTERRLIKAESDARSAYGKVFDMQETRNKEMNDALDDAQRKSSVEIYGLQRALDTCITEKPKK